MKTLITLLTALFLLLAIGSHPVSKGVKGGSLRELAPMTRLSHTFAKVDSGSDGVGGPSFDSGISSFFN